MLFFAFVKKLNYHITLMVTDNSTNGYSTLECKDYVVKIMLNIWVF